MGSEQGGVVVGEKEVEADSGEGGVILAIDRKY